MRILCVAVLVVLGAGALQTQLLHGELVVIVDSDGPVANADAPARLRQSVLAEVERDGRPVYFDLTAGAITRVPDTARDSFRLAPFTFQRSSQAGVSVGFDEAVQILRRNEAVRDAVVGRECSASPIRGCGSAVYVAATTVITDTELTSARKLRHLVNTAKSTGAATLVLITAGWPYRNEQQLRLDAAIREMAVLRTKLVVLRVPARFAYEGLVRDAAESLATRLSGSVIALNIDQDVHDAQSAVAGHRLRSEPPTAVPFVPLEPLEPRLPEDPLTAADLPDDLVRAAGYVGRFSKTFSSVMWRERYQQENRVRRRFATSGTSFSTVAGSRLLDSELLFLWLPRDAAWIAVRDVVAIDGKPRPINDRRLQPVLESQSVSVDQLRQLAAENGRFNIGRIVRTFNEPTLALLFLDAHYRHRFIFRRSGEQRLDGRPAATFEFVERGRPTIIQDQNRDVPVRGTLWVDMATGQVLQTSMELAYASGGLNGRMQVRYGPDPDLKFDVLVPLEMRETYTSASGEEVTTLATYSDFRRFEAAGRLVLPKVAK